MNIFFFSSFLGWSSVCYFLDDFTWDGRWVGQAKNPWLSCFIWLRIPWITGNSLKSQSRAAIYINLKNML